jgi:outer membrane lipoprotein-sorting protein
MYRPHLRLLFLVLLTAATFPLSGCLFRTRRIDRQFSNVPLKTATQQELIEYMNKQAASIQSMQATVDIDSSAADPKGGTTTDYTEIRGYILARKPAMLRMKGLLPVVRNTAFDMVSDGQEFRLWIPQKNKFVLGSNNADNYQPDKRFENMRPQYIYDALLMPEIGRDDAVRENGYETVLDAKRHHVEQPNYSLLVIRKGPQGAYLARKIDFSRVDLLPYRQRIYDQEGNVVTDVHYHDYKDFGGTTFPNTVEIERPRENYDIVLNMVKLDINKTLTDDQFVLDQPPGADLVRLDQANTSEVRTADRPSK